MAEGGFIGQHRYGLRVNTTAVISVFRKRKTQQKPAELTQDGAVRRRATMNAAVNAGILERHVLTTSFDRQLAAEKNLPLDGYDVILANPPFSGRLGRDRIVDDVKISASTATELLFVKYMIDNLKGGGRCGVVVPEGVLSNSRVAHKELRRMLMENNRVEAMLSLPGGLFQPYSGVKTSVLIFGQGGRTERVSSFTRAITASNSTSTTSNPSEPTICPT
jgi:hypothetical protein